MRATIWSSTATPELKELAHQYPCSRIQTCLHLSRPKIQKIKVCWLCAPTSSILLSLKTPQSAKTMNRSNLRRNTLDTTTTYKSSTLSEKPTNLRSKSYFRKWKKARTGRSIWPRFCWGLGSTPTRSQPMTLYCRIRRTGAWKEKLTTLRPKLLRWKWFTRLSKSASFCRISWSRWFNLLPQKLHKLPHSVNQLNELNFKKIIFVSIFYWRKCNQNRRTESLSQPLESTIGGELVGASFIDRAQASTLIFVAPWLRQL